MINKDIPLNKIVEWDIESWLRSFVYWEEIGKDVNLYNKKGLELGARNGGTSAFFVSKFNVNIECSDFGFPTQSAYDLHREYGLEKNIVYSSINAIKIPHEDSVFDFVVFKSILGTIGSYGAFENIEDTIKEILRVLKPGGHLFFSENLRATIIHNKARKLLVPWGKRWHYVSLLEMKSILSEFAFYEIKTTGFLSAFVPNSFKNLKYVVSKLDSLLNWLPAKWHYISYGFAQKNKLS